MQFEKVSLEQFTKDCEMGDVSDIYDDIKLPARATSGSAGYDFYLPYTINVRCDFCYPIMTGIRAKIDSGYFLLIAPRSSLAVTYGMRLCNTIGIIDQDYYDANNEGHIILRMTFDEGDVTLQAGTKIAQGILIPYATVDGDCVTKKRIGGFGSTGESDNEAEILL